MSSVEPLWMWIEPPRHLVLTIKQTSFRHKKPRGPAREAWGREVPQRRVPMRSFGSG